MKNIKNMNKAGGDRKVKFVGGVLTAGLLMFGTASFAQERDNVTNTDVNDFEQRDINADQQLDRTEYDTRMEEDRTFETWDTDRDGILNENEFNEGNRVLQEQRTQQGLNDPQDQPAGTINTQDGTTETLNNNNTGVFNDWDTDTDGTINRDEFNQGTYNTLDRNQDGTLDADEYSEGINTYGTDTGVIDGTNDTDLNRGTEITPGTGTETTPGTGTGSEIDY